VAPNEPMSKVCPDKLVMIKMDHIETVLLIKLQMAKR
jgi:hypothetical protein